jgi:WD40 repeat protein
VDTGQQLATFQSSKDSIQDVAFSPDGKTIAIADWNSSVRLWDMQTKTLQATLSEHIAGGVDSISFSPDGHFLLTSGSWDSNAKLWDIGSRKIVNTFSGHSDWISTVDYSSDDRDILTGGFDHSARLWDAVTGKQLYVLCPSFISLPWFISLTSVVLLIGLTILGFIRERKLAISASENERRQYRNFSLVSLALSILAFIAFFGGYVLPNFYYYSYNPVKIGYATFLIWSVGAVVFSAYHDYRLKRLMTSTRSKIRMLASATIFSVLMFVFILFVVGVSFVMYPVF